MPKPVLPTVARAATAVMSKEEVETREQEKKAQLRAQELKAKPARTRVGAWWRRLQMSRDKLSPVMAVIAIGIVYGDIGTSPLYMGQTFLAGQGGMHNITPTAVYGMLSLLFWTVTLTTTIKYVLIMMRIDNKGEGGLLALFTMVRRYKKWLIIPAMIGAAAFLADSVLTPAVTISSAVEGLRTIPAIQTVFENPYLTLGIIVVIILVLFLVQSRGTEKIGKVFGPVMIVWFCFVALMGILSLGGDWSIFVALNPVYAIKFLFSPQNVAGIAVMGTVFLAITGAEALYSDMGHVGRGSIYLTWPFIMVCLLINYFGQGAWMLRNANNPALDSVNSVNPFFQMIDPNIRSVGVILSVIAGVIASQALISGAFTIVSEATGLNLMPHLQVRYPSRTRGQIYIPAVNTVLCVLVLVILAIFRDSEHITPAYGLSLTITMLATTTLLFAYLWWGKHRRVLAVIAAVVYFILELMFFFSSLTKFINGAWFTVVLAAILATVMYSWYVGTKVERSQRRHMSPDEFLPALNTLHQDIRYPYFADNIVYLTSDTELRRLDTDIFYSIFANHPKRARAWWAISVVTTDDPYTREYSVENFGTDFLYRVRIRLGFKVNQNIATYLRQIMHELIDNGELPEQTTIYPRIDADPQIGTIRYVLIHKNLIPESKISFRGIMALKMKYGIRHLAGSPVKWFGLAAYNPVIENLPLFVSTASVMPLKRTHLRKPKRAITLDAVLAANNAEEETLVPVVRAETETSNE
jgi:KUP system potassium uptake protein